MKKGKDCNCREYVNERWLLSQFDLLHDILCPDKTGTWQMRVLQVVEEIKLEKI